VLLLADHFCRQLGAKYGLGELTIAQEARPVLQQYEWPGNVRELRHALESAALRISGSDIQLTDLAATVKVAGLTDPIERAMRQLDQNEPIHLEEVERTLIQQALQRTGGNVS